MKFTHKLKFPNIGSFIFALCSYCILIFIIIFVLAKTNQNEGKIYTLDKNSFMDITLSELDLFNDDSSGKSESGIVSKKEIKPIKNIQNEIKKEDEKVEQKAKEVIQKELKTQQNTKTPEIQSQNNVLSKNIEQKTLSEEEKIPKENKPKQVSKEAVLEDKKVQKPQETQAQEKKEDNKKEEVQKNTQENEVKQEKKEEVDAKKLFQSTQAKQSDENKEDEKLSNLFSSSTKDIKDNNEKSTSSSAQNNEITKQNKQSQVKKATSSNAQKKGIYDPYFGEIQKIVDTMWNRYRLPKIQKMPSIIISLNKKGEVLKIDKKAISNVQYMEKVDDLIDAIKNLRSPQFPAAPQGNNFDSIIKIEINLGILN